VVVAVRGAARCGCGGLRNVVVEEDAAVVVEFGDEHRRLEAVVEDVAGAESRIQVNHVSSRWALTWQRWVPVEKPALPFNPYDHQ
jgi:hypothetical protein